MNDFELEQKMFDIIATQGTAAAALNCVELVEKQIKQLEAENKTLRESTIDECIVIAKEAFNHQWPIRSCVDKFITLKSLAE